jgi:hypothetical protein
VTEPDVHDSSLRAGLVEALRETRAVEREVFAALGPAERDRPAADGGWSAKDILAHLSAWRQRQADSLAARREGRPDPNPPGIELDAINATIHAERAGWRWDQVVADAELTAEALIAEASAAGNDALTDPKTVGSIMVDGPEHDLGHLAQVAAGTGLESRVAELAETTRAIIDRGGWPSRAAAIARYNLACFHALNGDLDVARSLLRQALPEEEELRTLAPRDADLTVLWDEIPTLAAGRP